MDEKQILSALANVLSGQMQHGNKADGTGTAIDYYQTGGLFGTCLGDNVLVNALVGPTGVEELFNWVPTTNEIKFTDAITGIVITGTNATQTTSCGDCQTIDMKGCTLKYPIGRFCAQTVEEQFDNLGMRANENVPIKTLFGNIVENGKVLVPMGTQVNDRFLMDVQMVAYLLRYRLGQMLWTGDVTNSAGPVKEFDGLEIIVNTGKVDAITGTACNALNSFLLNINSNNWTSDGTYAVRRWFARMIQQFQKRARGAGFDWNTAEHHIVMTDNMWDTVSRLYACTGLDLCSVGNAQNEVSASADMVERNYQEMLRRQALLILGKWYPVTIDSQMTETDNGDGTFTSDIYFLTTRLNGQDVMWGEYQDFSQTFASAAAELRRMFGRSGDISWTDNGMFALLENSLRGCFDIQMLVKPRLVSRMPQLSGRLQNAVAQPVGDVAFPDVSGSGDGQDLSCGRRSTGFDYLYNRSGPGSLENFNETNPDSNVFPTNV